MERVGAERETEVLGRETEVLGRETERLGRETELLERELLDRLIERLALEREVLGRLTERELPPEERAVDWPPREPPEEPRRWADARSVASRKAIARAMSEKIRRLRMGFLLGTGLPEQQECRKGAARARSTDGRIGCKSG